METRKITSRHGKPNQKIKKKQQGNEYIKITGTHGKTNHERKEKLTT